MIEFKRTLFFGAVFILFMLYACSDKAKSSETFFERNFIYRNYFLLDSIPQTLDPVKDVKQLSELNDIPDSLISKWVKPFREIGYDGNKMISYQHEGEKYNAVLIGIIDETNINKKDQDHYYVVLTQYLLTVKDDGSLIEGLKVQEFIPGGDLLEGNLDSARYEKLILNKNIYGRFKRDTIKIFDRTLYLKETGTNNEELKQEEYEGIDETTYVISANGKIKKVGDKKGELKKLSEDTGERMKLK